MDVARSIHNVPIRLTHERWYHIVENHDDLASCFYDVLDTVEAPDLVLRGHGGTLKAVGCLGKGKWLVAIHRGLSTHDGFIVTAYTLDAKPKGQIVWRP